MSLDLEKLKCAVLTSTCDTGQSLSEGSIPWIPYFLFPWDICQSCFPIAAAWVSVWTGNFIRLRNIRSTSLLSKGEQQKWKWLPSVLLAGPGLGMRGERMSRFLCAKEHFCVQKTYSNYSKMICESSHAANFSCVLANRCEEYILCVEIQCKKSCFAACTVCGILLRPCLRFYFPPTPPPGGQSTIWYNLSLNTEYYGICKDHKFSSCFLGDVTTCVSVLL